MRYIFAILLLLVGPTWASTCDDGEVAQSIQAQRARFNDAIRVADIEPLEGILHSNVILVTGTDSDVFRGREAQIELWNGDFRNSDRAVYVRSPECIRVSSRFPVASEYGTWRGERPNGAHAAGFYTAKWRRVEERWMLEVEVFATEECSGDFCRD